MKRLAVIVLAFGWMGPAQATNLLQRQWVQDVKFDDPALATCVQTYAAEQGYVYADEVKEIPCFNRAIKWLGGLEAFQQVLVVDVSRNFIQDFRPIFKLGDQLGYLDIHDNPVPCTQMILLSRIYPKAYLVGFDPRTCVVDFPVE